MRNLLKRAAARILLRYLSGAIIGTGLLTTGDALDMFSDPDMQNAAHDAVDVAIGVGVSGVGAVMGVVSERAYTLAKRFGWET